MQNKIVINATPGETRVAVFEKKAFVEFHLERSGSRRVEGQVVKGRVNRVLPGMQAAFVDIGLEKAGYLAAADYVEDIEELGDEEEGNGRRRGRKNRDAPSIDTLLEEGQEILVQIAKEPIGSKGARVNSRVSIAGRHLVLTPWSQGIGLSRKIQPESERRRLRGMLKRLKPADLGFIIRTAGAGLQESDLAADLRYLTRTWDDIQILKEQVKAPALLYANPELALRVVRDFVGRGTEHILVDSKEVYEKMLRFVDEFASEPKPRIEHYQGAAPIFEHFGAESVLDDNLGRRVALKSGGYLVIDQNEALTSIDVNTGRYVGRGDVEQTILQTNLEAVQEVANQLRFRDIGGLIIIDLIDMEVAENLKTVNQALRDAFRRDKAKTNILDISALGLVEMTRKRTRENLVQTLCEPCSHCDGKGYLASHETTAYRVLREIRKDITRLSGKGVVVKVNNHVAEHLLGPAGASLAALEKELGIEVEVRARSGAHPEQFEIASLAPGGAEAEGAGASWLDELAEQGVGERAARLPGLDDDDEDDPLDDEAGFADMDADADDAEDAESAAPEAEVGPADMDEDAESAVAEAGFAGEDALPSAEAESAETAAPAGSEAEEGDKAPLAGATPPGESAADAEDGAEDEARAAAVPETTGGFEADEIPETTGDGAGPASGPESDRATEAGEAGAGRPVGAAAGGESAGAGGALDETPKSPILTRPEEKD